MWVKSQQIIKINPLGLAFGSLNVGYESFINDKNSFYLGANFIGRKILGIKYSGFGIGGQYRWYLTDNERPKGLWVGPSVALNFVNFKDNVEKLNYTLIQLGGIIGYQFTFGDKFTAEIGLGPSYGIISGSFDDFNIYGDGVLPTGILSLGYILGS